MTMQRPQTVGVSGATGLVGGRLVADLQSAGHRLVRLVRQAAHRESEVALFGDAASTEHSKAQGWDAVVHLAGENIAAGRWSHRQMERIRDSRTLLTRRLCDNLSQLKSPPKALVCASAIGYYGDRGDETLTEERSAGSGFLADVCREWEAATEPARKAGIRVVHLRTGMVLAKEGGALAKMLTPFRFGLGGKIGPGTQYWSWITLDDLSRVIQFALDTPTLSGPVNAVAPQPVTNLDFTRCLGKALHRPTWFPLPAFMAKMVLGKMAQDLLLNSARVVPQKLVRAGFHFQYAELNLALNHLLG